MAACLRERFSGPSQLLRVEEADSLKSVQDIPGKDTRVPDIRHLNARHKLECFRPIGSRIARDGGLCVALPSVFHVAGLRGPAAVQARATPPLAVERDPVRRISDE